MRLSEFIKKIPTVEYHTVSEKLPNIDIKDVTPHSSKTSPNCAFVAIKGNKKDGEDYIPEARKRGCKVFLTTRKVPIFDGECLIITKSTRDALALSAKLLFGECVDDMKLVGITGTKGKTTTALLLSSILASFGIKHILSGTLGIELIGPFGNGITYQARNTTPEPTELYRALKRAYDLGIKVGVIEVSSQAMLQSRLLGINFDAAIFTNLSPDHIGREEHRDFFDYYSSKKRLFTDHGVKLAVVNSDDAYSKDISRSVPRSVSVGSGIMADVRITDTKAFGGRIEFSLLGEYFSLSMKGDYNVKNASLAIITAKEVFGLPISEMKDAVFNKKVPGRYEEYELDGIKIIIDFAHNPESFRAVMTTARRECEGKLISVFGSVGGRSDNRRAALGSVAAELCDFSVITSDNPAYEDASQIAGDILLGFPFSDKAIIVTDREEAIKAAVSIAEKGDTVLLLGKGHECFQEIGSKLVPFSERRIIEKMGARKI